MHRRIIGALVLSSGLIVAQEPAPQPAAPETFSHQPAAAPAGLKASDTPQTAPANGKAYFVDPGTKVPLSMINSINTKNSTEGDRVYLETVFPVVDHGRVVIPVGSYVAGTVTRIKRPGRVKGRGEFYVRFDSLTLPNGVTRDFRARISNLDGRASESMDKEGTVKSEGDKAGDARTIASTTVTGASVGAMAGGLGAGRAGMGGLIGAGAGAAAGLAAVLLTRGPDAVLARGTTVEMVLDRQLRFDESEIDFSKAYAGGASAGNGPGPMPSVKDRQGRGIGIWPW